MRLVVSALLYPGWSRPKALGICRSPGIGVAGAADVREGADVAAVHADSERGGLSEQLARPQSGQTPDRQGDRPVTPGAARTPGLSGQTVLRGGPELVLVPGLHEVFVGVHGWFPSAGRIRWAVAAPVLPVRRPAGRLGA